MKFKFCHHAIVGTALLAASVVSLAQTTIEFDSLNRKQGFPAILQGRAEYTDRISGVFTRPDGKSGNFPVMVIMHSSGGIITETWEWSKFFLKMGIATFVVDSFKPRGIGNSTMDQSQISYPASVSDALLALKVIAAQPGIDSKRIGVIGYSRGAVAAATSAFENIRAGVLGKDNALKFALHIAYYGGCSMVGTTTGVPMQLFVGDRDNIITPETCGVAVSGLKAKGANVIDYVAYPGALHSFDVQRDKEVYVANAQSFKGCAGAVQDLDTMDYFIDERKVSSKEYGDYFATCMTKGYSIGYNYSAKADSQKRVAALVAKTFGL